MSESLFPEKPAFMSHPLIKPDTVEQRLYQLNLAGKALEGSSLVVLPTGLGKTIIALFVIASRLQRFGGKALILSPTKPLVEQHAAFFKKVMALPEEEVLAFTGSISPTERERLWAQGKLIVSTPQVIENDILTRRIGLEDVSHITFDEAHRAVGNYAYTFIAEKYFESARNPHILGITASPGSSDEKISEVCEALHVQNVAVKTEKDRDVKPYVQEKEIEWLHVNLPAEMAEIRSYLEKIFNDRLAIIRNMGFSVGSGKYVSKKDLLLLQKKLQGEIRIGGDPAIFSAMSVVAEIMKVNHAVEMVETQGIEALRKYLEKLDAEASSSNASKAAKRLMDDLYMRKTLYRVKECDVEHPKLEVTRKIVCEQLEGNPDSRVIVFTNYRDSAEMVTNALSEVSGIIPVRFVGQGSRHKDKGLTQKKQVEILDRFRAGEYNVLVATSVAEEGLDIPATDLVLFYEPVPSEIRSIQRKGRTGRQHKGRVTVLVTKGTRDEAYYWSSKNKEKRMLNSMHGLEAVLGPKTSKKSAALSDFEGLSFVLDSTQNSKPDSRQDSKPELLENESEIWDKIESEDVDKHPDGDSSGLEDVRENGNGDREDTGMNLERSPGDSGKKEGNEKADANIKERQKTLVDFGAASGENSAEPLKIVVDHRETKCGVAKALDRLGMELSFMALEIGDYIVSDRLAVERKRTDDFASSLIDGKRNLFAQLSDLSRVYEKPVLIIEGEDLFTSRQINPNAIYGSLVSIAIDFGVSILYSRDEEETASILKILAKREQTENKREINPHGKKSASTLAEQQEYLISSISNIGPKAAKNLLSYFGSVEAVMRADIEELKKVKQIGPKTAARIREVLESPYKG
ncbi:DEAD/DEAH box helicase [Methanosarcina hadiensis]|uniref:DEAD/DEAH box helicase n=1 Tax=Methanosarcina hadiensis TaxID=3078083 RepID=UPI0039776643